MKNILTFNAKLLALGLADKPQFIHLPSQKTDIESYELYETIEGGFSITQLLNMALVSLPDTYNGKKKPPLPQWWWDDWNKHSKEECYLNIDDLIQYVEGGNMRKSCYLPPEVIATFEHAPKPTRQLIAMLCHPRDLEYDAQPLPSSIHSFATACQMFRLMKTDGDQINSRDTPLQYSDCVEMMARVVDQKNDDFDTFFSMLVMLDEYQKNHDVTGQTQWLLNMRLDNIPPSNKPTHYVFLPIGLLARYFNPNIALENAHQETSLMI